MQSRQKHLVSVPIRGSGTHRKNFHQKGGVAATRQMIDTLEQGINVAMTADVPKLSRRAGLGVVSIAKHTGRPIYPGAIATSNRIIMKRSWDKSSFHLPFGRAALVIGDADLSFLPMPTMKGLSARAFRSKKN